MATFEIEIGGKVYEVEAPSQDAALAAIQGMNASPPPPQPQQPIAQGDWQGLAQRVQAAGEQMPAGMNRESAMAEQSSRNRIAEARRQGSMYGAKQGEGSTFGRSLANTIGMGLPNLLEAYTPGWAGGQDALPGAEAHEFIKAADAARGQANPKSALAGNVLGAVAQGVTMPAAKIAGSGAGPTALRVGQAAGIGGIVGGTEGYINSRGDIEEMQKAENQGFLYGGVGGAAGELAGRAISGAAGLFNKKPQAPSLDDLKARQSAAYQQFDQINPIYDGKELAAAQGRLQQRFADFGGDPMLQPGAFRALDRLSQDVSSGQPITGKGLETLRRVANKASEDPMQKSNNALAGMIREEIEGIMANPNAAISGNAKAAADAVSEAREMTKRIKKQEIVDQLLEKASIRADRAGSGGNVDNATRQELSKLLDPKSKQGKMFTPDERDAIRELVKGTLMGNVMRGVGKLSPQGSGLMSALGIGGAAMNPMAAIPFAAGAIAKPIGDKMTANSAQRIGELIRSGGNAAALRASPNAVQRIASDPRLPIFAALMGTSIAPTGSQ